MECHWVLLPLPHFWRESRREPLSEWHVWNISTAGHKSYCWWFSVFWGKQFIGKNHQIQGFLTIDCELLHFLALFFFVISQRPPWLQQCSEHIPQNDALRQKVNHPKKRRNPRLMKVITCFKQFGDLSFSLFWMLKTRPTCSNNTDLVIGRSWSKMMQLYFRTANLY